MSSSVEAAIQNYLKALGVTEAEAEADPDMRAALRDLRAAASGGGRRDSHGETAFSSKNFWRL